MTEDTIPIHKRIADRMRRRARMFQVQAYLLLAITLAIAGYAAFFFVVEDQTFSVSFNQANLENSRIEFPESNIFDFLTSAILRIGAVLLAVFVIQLLFSLVRYRVKLSEDLDNRADMIELCFDDENKLELVKAVASMQGTDIGSMPDHPYGKFADAIKEIAGKLPSK
ncbi:hypothetical protein [Primorskyibacter sedentarius]|uniref:hypothetical protein n=1 Tax=Primorskyibacter sedentarius TaxID=745311 RepID=UPI001052CAB9|nr:hypothetical protein [Primorskyibacter sedentarius]